MKTENQTLMAAVIRSQGARIKTLEDAIQAVLNDSESQEGGWGPDVTMLERLRAALVEKSTDRI